MQPHASWVWASHQHITAQPGEACAAPESLAAPRLAVPVEQWRNGAARRPASQAVLVSAARDCLKAPLDPILAYPSPCGQALTLPLTRPLASAA